VLIALQRTSSAAVGGLLLAALLIPHAPEELQAQVFTISAGLRLTMAAAGAAIGGALAGLPSATQLIFAASTALFAGGFGALALSISSHSSSEQAQLRI
jgi:hypothetical protein